MGSFYGVTYSGGAKDDGTIFKITPSGTLTTLQQAFATPTPATARTLRPGSQAADGNFYGTTRFGGGTYCAPYGCGMVFKITASGTLTMLHSFDNTDGGYPAAGLVQASDGNFYGTTPQGGAYDNCFPQVGCGTAFKISPEYPYMLTTMHSFARVDGALPSRRADAGQRREPLRNDFFWGRRRRVWHGLQNHHKRNADHPAQLRQHPTARTLSPGLSKPPTAASTAQLLEAGPTAPPMGAAPSSKSPPTVR